MYPVTKEFKEKIKTPFNRQVYGKIEVDYTDPFLDQSIQISSNENANISYPFQVADSVINPVGKIISLDGSCSLDGSYVLAPVENIKVSQMGWWGSKLSSGTSIFTAPYPSLIVNFTSRPILKITISGDNARGEYPVNFKVRMYSESDVLLSTETITGNSKVNFERVLGVVVTGVSKLVLEITKWSHPLRQVKITEFYTSIREIYEDSDIVNISLTEQRGDTSAGIPFGQVTSSEIDISLNNVDKKFDAGNKQSPLYNLLRPNRRIKPYLGIKKDDESMEYVPLGTFWSEDWSVSSSKLYAKTSGGDKLSLMGNTFYSTIGVINNFSLYNLAYEVLNDYGFADDEFLIDDSLNYIIIPYVIYKDKPHVDVLKDIAQACMGQVYTNRNGLIIIESINPVSTSYDAHTNENANVSFPYQVTDGIYEPSGLFLSLDGYSVLDGSYTFAPSTIEDGEMGWWGFKLSDANGNFSVPYPTLNIKCFPKIVSDLKVNGDIARYEYPVNFDVNVYDIDNNIIGSTSIIDNTLVERDILITETLPTAVRIELIVKKWNLPNAQVKILEFSDTQARSNISINEYFVKNNPLSYKDMANNVIVEYTPMDNLGEQGNSLFVNIANEQSVLENGLVDFMLSGNPLIQTQSLANIIANHILSNFSDPERNLDLQWRGNPAYILGDIINVYDKDGHNDYVLIEQNLNYSGFLRATLKGRKVVRR